MKKRILLAALLFFAAFCTNAGADELSELKAQLAEQQKLLTQMQQRLEQLEAKQAAQEQTITEQVDKAVKENQVSAVPDSLKWAEKINFYGDFRLRHETINEEGKDTNNRERARFRLGMNAELNDELDFGLRLASGSADPVSTNQTLGDGFSSKDFWLDLFFVDYHPAAMPGLDVIGGKMLMPFYKVGENQLIWDSDLNPEGLAATYVMPLGDNDTLNVNSGLFVVDDRSGQADASLWGMQGYLRHIFEDESYLLGGAGLYCYGNLQGYPTVFDEQDGFGNTTFVITPDDPATTCCDEEVLGYEYNYRVTELFGEYGFTAGGMPVRLYGDWIKNNVAPSSHDTGWLVGLALNKAKKAGSWELSYDYRELESDATLGLFTDSDFIGGGTGGKGHRFGAVYQIADNIQSALTYFLDEKDPDEHDYDRLQADLIFKF
jgi:uncharacterized coiled-coil protein SlyX